MVFLQSSGGLLVDHQKMNISFFDDLGGLFLHFSHCLSLGSLGRSSEVKHNPKMSLSFFWLEKGVRWGLSPSTSPADHQKLNVIQK